METMSPTQKDIRVRSVRADTLFRGEPQKLTEILAKFRGQPYRLIEQDFKTSWGQTVTKTTRDLFLAEVQHFFEESTTAAHDGWFGVNRQNALYIRAKFFDDCVTIVPEPECAATLMNDKGTPVSKCVDILVRAKVIPIDTGSLSANLLDLARSNKLRFYRELPSSILMFQPQFWIDQDRNYQELPPPVGHPQICWV